MRKSPKERAWLYYQRLARRAKKGLKVPQEFLDCASSLGLFYVTADKYHKDATKLAEMRRSDEHGISDITEFLDKNPINTGLAKIMYDRVEISYQQSDKGKNPPKPRITNRSLTIEAMRTWRNEGHTFNDFMDAAQNDSIDKLSLYQVEPDDDGLTLYKEKLQSKSVVNISWEGLESEDRLLNTLIDWWTDCNKDATKK